MSNLLWDKYNNVFNILYLLPIGDAEWAKLSEQERQAKLIKMRLEQKRLLKEGKLDEAARLLGDGFKADANLKKLMGENKKK